MGSPPDLHEERLLSLEKTVEFFEAKGKARLAAYEEMAAKEVSVREDADLFHSARLLDPAAQNPG